MTRRLDRDAALALLATRGKEVTIRTSELIEDVDGDPLGVIATEEPGGFLWLEPEHIGWTWAELGIDDPDFRPTRATP